MVARLHCRLGCPHEEETPRYGYRSRSSWCDRSHDVIGECAGPRYESWVAETSRQTQADADAYQHTDADSDSDSNPDADPDADPDAHPDAHPNPRRCVGELLARL